MEQITAQGQPKRVPGSWRRPGLVTTTAVLAAMAIVTALNVGLRGAPNADAAAAAFLGRMSTVAAARNNAANAPGHFSYQRTTSIDTFDAPLNGDVIHVRSQQTSEWWIAPDGSGRNLATAAQLSPSTPDDKRRWTAAGSPELRALLRAHSIEEGHDAKVPAGSSTSFGLGIGNLNAAS